VLDQHVPYSKMVECQPCGSILGMELAISSEYHPENSSVLGLREQPGQHCHEVVELEGYLAFRN
jgi:hypothetical protein